MSVMGMLVLLPIQAIDLPLNMAPVDVWNLIGLPLVWIYLLVARRHVQLPYIQAMWMIALGSVISMFWARDPSTASVVVAKEVYLYVWFVSVAALLAQANAQTRQSLLIVWAGTVVLHGIVIVVEFLSADVWHMLASFFGSLGKVEVIRPPGLFDNANGAGFYQLMGFVPVALSCSSVLLGVLFGLGLVLSIVGTGSLGATAGLLAGTVVAIVAKVATGGRRKGLYGTVVWLFVIAALLLGIHAFAAARVPDYEERLAYFFYGRAERSATGRIGLWESGISALWSPQSLWGSGPGNVTDPVTGKTLHNDLLAFALERGVLGFLGLLVFGAIATYKALRIVSGASGRLPEAVFLAVVVAGLVDSSFHQVFHERAFWLVLAAQEAALWRTIALKKGLSARVARGVPSTRFRAR